MARQVFPDPATDHLIHPGEFASGPGRRRFSSSGRLVQRTTHTLRAHQQLVLAVGGLPPGSYFLHLNTVEAIYHGHFPR